MTGTKTKQVAGKIKGVQTKAGKIRGVQTKGTDADGVIGLPVTVGPARFPMARP